MSTETQSSTKVDKVEIDLDELLQLPGEVLLPSDQNPPVNNFFKKGGVDPKIFDIPNPAVKTEDTPADTAKTEDTPTIKIDDVLEDFEEEDDDTQTTSTTNKGRQKVDKSGIVDLFKKATESGLLVPFEDDKNIEDYSINDFEELLQANIRDIEERVKAETPKEFFESLPKELQYAAQYVANGGTDLKSLFRNLSQVEEIRELDPENLSDQIEIVRSYLLATNFGNEDEIQEEIDSWKDRNELGAKALKFKPKLDMMHEQLIQKRVAQQEEIKRMQQERANKYMQDVFEALKPGELNGIKLDKKTQQQLYSGLTVPQYQGLNGRPTNLLGHLLEKYQVTEPNPSLVAEALWLLSDPEGYRNKIKEKGSEQTTEKTVRLLKSEQANKNGSTTVIEEDTVHKRTLPRNNNFFKRNP